MTARVLVVDDVEVNVKLLEAKLASEYFSVVSANNGPSALEIAIAESPDIILLDVMMPRMDGFEVCRRLKADPLTADIPVVMVTALSDVSDRLRGLEAGADDFLTKPVNDTALFARMRSLVRLKRMMDELRLREEVCGRFSPAGTGDEPTADLDAARILLVAEPGFATSRIVNTLKSVTAAVIRASSRTSRRPSAPGIAPIAICRGKEVAPKMRNPTPVSKSAVLSSGTADSACSRLMRNAAENG